MPGQLSVTAVAAKKLKGGDFFDKADPYVTIYIEHKHKKKTTVKKNAGSNAEWNETLVLDVTEGHQLYVEVFDKDLMNDDLIGGVVVDLQPVFTTGRFDQWLTIRTSSGKISGEVHLIIIFYNRDQATGQSGGYYASQPAGNYQALPPQSGGYAPPPGPPPQSGGYAPPPGPPPQSGGYLGEKNDYTSLGPRAGAIPQGYGTGAPPPFDPSSIPPINYIPGAPGAGTPMPGGYAPPPGPPPQSGGYAPPPGPPPQSGGYAPPPGPPPQSGGYVPPPGPPPQSGGYAPPPEAEEKKHNVPAWAATAGVAAAAAGLGFLGTKIYEEHKHEKHEHEYKHQQEHHQEPYRHDSYKHNRRGDEYWQ